jgi:dolichol-phosphate mannosyltransferase
VDLSIVVPTFNEAPNIAELVRRITLAVASLDAEVIFVDDSRDETPEVIAEVARTSTIPVRLIHREQPKGGLGGAVVEGFAAAESDVCLVMDADLQHPPEKIPELYERMRRGGVDLVVASRYSGEGSAGGLADRTRVLVSRVSTMVTRAMFPIKLRDVTDPMTGFFVVDRRAVEYADLHPRGFKILLEMLARKTLRVAEVPFDFADRYAGESKASFRQGLHFLAQLTALRFGKMSLFAIVGGLGAIANVFIVWALVSFGVNYIVAAVIAAEATIIANFLLIERFVFQDMREQASGVWARFAKSFTFNNAEALIRIPVVAFLVSSWQFSAVIATAVTLVVAFFVRFLFHSLVVYAPKRSGAHGRTAKVIDELDRQALRPGEL